MVESSSLTGPLAQFGTMNGSMTNLLVHIRVELLVPWAEERVCDVQPLSIQAQLNHLWSSSQSLALHHFGRGLALEWKECFITLP